MFVVDSAQMHSNTLIQCQINKEKVPSGLHMAFMLVEHEVPSYMITPPPLSLHCEEMSLFVTILM